MEKKNISICILLCCGAFIGLGGLHDFYLKRWGWAVAKLLTFDFLWVGAIYDLKLLLKDEYSSDIADKWDKKYAKEHDPAKTKELGEEYAEDITNNDYRDTSIRWTAGSDNQVAWADSIVQGYVEKVNALIENAFDNNRITPEEGRYFARSVECAFQIKDNANFWIDNRKKSVDKILEKILEDNTRALEILKKL